MYEQNESGLWVPKDGVRVGGSYLCQHLRDETLIDEWTADNLVVNQGLDSLLTIMFVNGTQITSWFLGVFTGNYTPVASDTASTFPAAASENTAYTSATRPAFTGSEASQNVTNSGSVATFTFNAAATIYGAFLVSNATKGGTGGVLFSAAQFTSPKSMAINDQLLLTYSFTASSV